MISKIAAKNFKAFGNSPGLDLSLSRLNFLLGQNNSGKTSALDVVALMVQSARLSQNYSGFAWSGELIDLGQSGDFASHNKAPTGFEIEIQIQPGPTFQEHAPEFLRGTETIGYRVSFRPANYRYKYEFLIDGHVLARNLTKDMPMGGNRAELEILDFPAPRVGMDYIPANATQSNLFNPLMFSSPNIQPATNAAHTPVAQRLAVARDGIELIKNFLAEKVFLLGPNRGNQTKNLNEPFKLPDVGRNGQHTLQILSTVFAKAEYRNIAKKIREWANAFGLSDVTAGWAGGQELHSGYADSLTGAVLPLHSAGFGSQQVLPIIVQLFAAPNDSVVIIEEPEISLHPAAQVQLVRMFSDAVRAGRQVITTTHSQYLVMALQEEAQGPLQAGDIRVYHFSRTKDDSTAEGLQIDGEGIVRGWIPSFAEVEQKLLKRWMARVHDKLTE